MTKLHKHRRQKNILAWRHFLFIPKIWCNFSMSPCTALETCLTPLVLFVSDGIEGPRWEGNRWALPTTLRREGMLHRPVRTHHPAQAHLQGSHLTRDWLLMHTDQLHWLLMHTDQLHSWKSFQIIQFGGGGEFMFPFWIPHCGSILIGCEDINTESGTEQWTCQVFGP